MEKDDRERLVRVEVGVTTLIETVKEHLKAGCLNCDLHDDVVSLKTTQKTARRITWTSLVVLLGVVGRYLVKGWMNV